MAGRLCMGSPIDLSILQAAVATVQPGGFKRCLMEMEDKMEDKKQLMS